MRVFRWIRSIETKNVIDLLILAGLGIVVYATYAASIH
jgi:hypothetical protein